MNHHDDHLALVIRDSYPRVTTTAQVSARVDQILLELARIRHQVRLVATLAGFTFGTALAAVIGLVVSR